MHKGKLWTLIIGPGLAAIALLLVFLLLGRSTASATPKGDDAAPAPRSPDATFSISGTVICKATGPISDAEVSAWDELGSSVIASDTTDSSGAYSVALYEGTYYLELVPSAATGLNAKAFTTTQLVTDTVLDVDFCVCSGVWVTETVDSVGRVGEYTSLALALTYPYTPHISYYDETNESLKHAWLSGATWLSETVETGGRQTSLALVPTYPYTPCISHHYAAVRFAYWNGTSWIGVEVEGGHSQGGVGISLALERIYPYTPHICYDLPWEVNDLKHAYLSGTVWMSGTWVRETVDSAGGGSCSLALEPTYPYTPHIAYGAAPELKHAWKSGTTWLSETVDSVGTLVRWISLALDNSGNPHIIYFDDTEDDLKYAWLSGTTWISETVESEGNVGYSTALALDSSDNPYISYYAGISGDLRLARFDGTVWIIQTVESEGNFGWTSLALSQMGCPHISYANRIYWWAEDLKHAYIPPPYLMYMPLVMRDHP